MNLRPAAFVLAVFLTSAVMADDATATGREEVTDDDIPTVVEITPAGVELVIGFNRLGEAIDRSFALNEELGMNYGPNDAREEFDRMIGANVVDYAGPITIFALTGFHTDDEGYDVDFQRLGAAVFVQDARAARITLGSDEALPDNEVFQAGFGPADPTFALPAAFQQRVLYATLGDNFSEILDESSLANEFDPGVVERLNAADIVAIAQRGPMLDELWHGILPPAAPEVDDDAWNDEQRQLARQLQQLTASIKWMTFAGSVAFAADDATLPTGADFGFSAICDHAPDSESAALLQSLGSDNQPTTFDGLPEGDAIVAIAGKLDGSNEIAVVRYVADVAFQLWNGSRGLPDSLIGEQFLSIFEEAGEHVQGGRLAIYRNADHAAHGRFSVVVIVDVEDPQAFLAEMRQLVRLASADEIGEATETDVVTDDEIRALVQQLGDRTYRVRRSATNQLMLVGPRAIPFLREELDAESLELRTRAQVILDQIAALNTYESQHFLGSDLFRDLEVDQSYVIAGEQLDDGTPVDLISIAIANEADQPFAQLLSNWLGPHWNRWRLAATDDHIVLVLGSRDELLPKTLATLQGNVDTQLEVPEWNVTDRPHQLEMHVDLRAFLPDGSTPGPVAPAAEKSLVSVGLAFARDTIHVDAFVPKSQLPVGGWPFIW